MTSLFAFFRADVLTNSEERSKLGETRKGMAKGMKGILAVDHELRSEKYASQFELYLRAAERRGVGLTVRTNAEEIPRDADFVLFLSKDVRLARTLEQGGRCRRVRPVCCQPDQE